MIQRSDTPPVPPQKVSNTKEYIHRPIEEALQKGEKQFQALIENSLDMITVLNPDGTIRYESPTVECMTGHTLEELKGKSIFDLIHPDDVPSVMAAFDRVIHTPGAQASIEVRSQNNDGTWHTFESVGKNLLDDPDVRGIIVNSRDITDRRTAEQALKESEEKFKTLADKSPNMIYIIQKGRIVYVNEKFPEVTGYSRQEHYSPDFNFMNNISPECRDEAMAFFSMFLDGKEPPPWEGRIITKDGKIIDIVHTPKIITYRGKTALMGIIIDISDRKKVEEALRESERRYRTLIDTSPDAIAVTDSNGCIVMANKQAVALHGYGAPEELIGKSALELVALADRGAAVEQMQKTIETGTLRGAEFTMLRRDGTSFPAELTASCLYDHDGRFTGIIGVARDISERRLTEEALRRREKLFRTLIENSKDIITMCDAEGKIIFESPSVEQIFGIPAEKRIGMSIFNFMHPNDIGIRSEKFFEAVRTHSDFPDFEVRYPRTDGTWRVLEGVGRNLLDDPEINAFVINCRDITDRKRLEELFLQSQKMETVGKLAGGIAHDLNNILTVITSYGGFVRDALSHGDAVREDIEEVLKASARATALVSQLLAFSRRQVIKPQTLNINSLILNMDKMLRRLIGENITLVTLPWPDLGPVKVDPGQIEQVIANLVVNARDAMPQGGTLTIETSNTTLDKDFVSHHLGASQGRHVMLAVSDTGVGMPDEVKKHLFEPFFTTKDVGKGSGLGLATVYGIIRQHKGVVWVYSEKGKGTTFKIYLPQIEEAVERTATEDKTSRLPGGNETILVVEDEEPVRKAAVRILHGLGYNVLDAANGEEALRLVKDCIEDIHLLLTDVVMPQMNGKELADRLTAMQPGLKILFMSGYTDNTIVGLSDFVEGAAYLQKPFSEEILARKIREVLGSAPGLGYASEQKDSA